MKYLIGKMFLASLFVFSLQEASLTERVLSDPVAKAQVEDLLKKHLPQGWVFNGFTIEIETPGVPFCKIIIKHALSGRLGIIEKPIFPTTLCSEKK